MSPDLNEILEAFPLTEDEERAMASAAGAAALSPTPTMSEAIRRVVPAPSDSDPASTDALTDLVRRLASNRPIPVGRLTRFWMLGNLQARIALAYLAWWLRTSFAHADDRERRLNETHLKSAIRLLSTMSYMRGAVMKVGQLLANYPKIVPEQYIEVLSSLHFDAPPMHFALLREHVRHELGRDPEEIFDDFETEAFAAASLGQVHRARLKSTGQLVAVKIQYPNIARTIRDDFRNLMSAVFPMRLSGDWDNLKDQINDLVRILELETDYENEARLQEKAREAFRESDRIVIPRVHREFSTKRILTTDYLPGVHLDEYLSSNPPQAARDRHGHQIMVATFRLYYAKKMAYADPHPGNFLFMPDGRLGLLDFGCCREFFDEDWDQLLQIERAIMTSREALHAAIARAGDLSEAQSRDEQRMKLLLDYSYWLNEPVRVEGPFDFGDDEYFRRGLNLWIEIVRRRYTRSNPVYIWIGRLFIGARAMVNRLKARIDVASIYKQEVPPAISRPR